MASTEEPYWLQDANAGKTPTANPMAQGTGNVGNNGPVYKPSTANGAVDGTGENGAEVSNLMQKRLSYSLFIYYLQVCVIE